MQFLFQSYYQGISTGKLPVPGAGISRNRGKERHNQEIDGDFGYLSEII